MKISIVQKNILHTICIIIIAVLLSILVLKNVGINDKIVEGMLEGMSPEASVDEVDDIGMFNTVKQ
jgi:hypothetical protein|tara:strand:+ start:540 stop:737 length:198 start_codon:yes stop_codon:yes gene_type:complete